eukprot:3075692-Rhodomonas_salina.2
MPVLTALRSGYAATALRVPSSGLALPVHAYQYDASSVSTWHTGWAVHTEHDSQCGETFCRGALLQTAKSNPCNQSSRTYCTHVVVSSI